MQNKIGVFSIILSSVIALAGASPASAQTDETNDSTFATASQSSQFEEDTAKKVINFLFADSPENLKKLESIDSLNELTTEETRHIKSLIKKAVIMMRDPSGTMFAD